MNHRVARMAEAVSGPAEAHALIRVLTNQYGFTPEDLVAVHRATEAEIRAILNSAASNAGDKGERLTKIFIQDLLHELTRAAMRLNRETPQQAVIDLMGSVLRPRWTAFIVNDTVASNKNTDDTIVDTSNLFSSAPEAWVWANSQHVRSNYSVILKQTDSIGKTLLIIQPGR